MDRLIDEVVEVRVSETVAGAASTNVNTAAVVGVTEKANAATQVLYDQESVEKAYETGTRRIVTLEPSLSTLAAGEIELSLGTAVVAKAKVNDGSSVRSVLKDLVSSFDAEGYVAKASSTKLTITSENYGATAVSDGAFSIEWDDTGFSGTINNTDGTDGADLVAVTKSFFEEAGPGKLVCIPVDSDPVASDIGDILEEALGMGRDGNNREIDFYNVVIRLGESATTQSVVALARALEEWCKTNFKLGHIEVQNRSVAEDAMAAQSDNPLTRVAIYYHKEVSGKSLAAALVSNRCGRDPARGTWALKTLSSITADPTSKDNFKNAEELGLNIYAKIARTYNTIFATIGTDMKFIDSVVKQDWMKFNCQVAVFDALREGNNGDGVNYYDDGIADIEGALRKVGNTAQSNENRYIIPDSFDVETQKYADIPENDKKKRNLPNTSAVFEVQETIHTTKTIELRVVR